MLKKLRQELDAACNERKTLHDTATAEDRDFTEQEQDRFDEIGVKVDSLKTRIKRAEQIDAEQADLDLPVKTSLRGANTPITVGANLLQDDPYGGYGSAREAKPDDKTLGRWFGEFAYDVARDRSGGAERLRKWVGAVRDRAFAAGDGMTSSIGSEGAYLIPAAFGALIDRVSLEAAVVRPRATTIPMASPRITFPVVDDTAHTSTVFGGIVAYFKSEEAQLTSSKPSFSNVELDLHKLTALAYVSGELLDWSPISLATWLPNKLAQAIAWKEDQKFISGTGTGGEPTGLLYATPKIEITKETSQAAATIVLENIIKMDARLWDQSGRNSVIWIGNRTIKTQLPKLVVESGSTAVPVFMPADGAAGRPLSTLYGYPIVFTEHAQALGTAGDIMLCNVAEYLIGDASGKTRTDRDMGLKFDYDQIAFRVITYTGGLCPWRAAFTPENGDSLSPVITLATRA